VIRVGFENRGGWLDRGGDKTGDVRGDGWSFQGKNGGNMMAEVSGKPRRGGSGCRYGETIFRAYGIPVGRGPSGPGGTVEHPRTLGAGSAAGFFSAVSGFSSAHTV